MFFWVGLILFCLASVVLFGILSVVMYPANRIKFLKGLVPLIVGGIVFLLIGEYLVRSEKKKKRRMKWRLYHILLRAFQA